MMKKKKFKEAVTLKHSHSMQNVQANASDMSTNECLDPQARVVKDTKAKAVYLICP